MAFTMNSDVEAALAAMLGDGAPPTPALGDIKSRRTAIEALQQATSAMLPMPCDVKMTDFSVSMPDEHELLLRWYTKEGSSPGSAVLYLHGGGMILSSVEIYDGPVARYVSESGVPFLSVEYRLAPEHPHPTLIEDCYAGLKYLHDNAANLGVDSARIAVMGDSGGGCLAAALPIMARDRGGPEIASQILIYPMLDDRNITPDPKLEPFVTWSYVDNETAWRAVLGENMGSDEVSPYAAPARVDSMRGLPPAFIEIGELDIFRDETLAYAQQLVRAGVSTELHMHPGVPHAFETMVPQCELALRVMQDRIRALKSF